jgi:hypothetical protein
MGSFSIHKSALLTEVTPESPHLQQDMTKRTILSPSIISHSFENFSALTNQVLSEDFVQKIWRVASRNPAKANTLPHYTRPETGEYVYEPSDWWTSGFFPGSIWILYERSLKRPLSIPSDQVLHMARRWQSFLEREQWNKDTHDIGFMIMPSFQRDYLLTGRKSSRSVIIQSAKSLMSRWREPVKCIRSWDVASTKQYTFSSPSTETLVIIDNMMNLDLLYYASELTGNAEFARIATIHAETTLQHHVRSDNSTCHLVVYDSTSGAVKAKKTVQGYAHESTWSRGQAWALYGFANVYKYTRDGKFLTAAHKLADYFVSRVEDGVVYWDFDAPRPGVWDTSAAMIACSGMLLLFQLDGDSRLLPNVFKILKRCVAGAVGDMERDSILEHATINNYEFAHQRIADHGLVYADYYFLEVGNRLCELGLDSWDTDERYGWRLQESILDRTETLE